MKKIGLVGGLGPASTVDYYLGLIDRARNTIGPEVYPEIVIYSVDFTEATGYFPSKQWQKSADLMVRTIEKLEKAGAEIAAITANTEHICWDLMKERFNIPVISILDAVVNKAIAKKYDNILVLGTAFTMQSGMFEKAFAGTGINLILPTEKDKERIVDLFFPNLENGIVIEEDKVKMLEIINRYINEQGVETVLLGCTELPLMIKEEDLSVPILNTTQIHIEAIFDAAKQELKEFYNIHKL